MILHKNFLFWHTTALGIISVKKIRQLNLNRGDYNYEEPDRIFMV